VVVTSLLTPILTAIWARRWGVLSAHYQSTQAAAFDPQPDSSGLEPTLNQPLK
jgi:2-keto-3-deoxygluconate permease